MEGDSGFGSLKVEKAGGVLLVGFLLFDNFIDEFGDGGEQLSLDDSGVELVGEFGVDLSEVNATDFGIFEEDFEEI